MLRFGLARKTLLVAGISLMAGGFIAWPAAASGKKEIGFEAGAYGTRVELLGVVKSGPSAAAGIGGGGCTTKTGVTDKNTLATLNVSPLLKTGAIDNSAASRKTHTGVAATASSRIAHVSLLKGLIRATAVKAVATTARNSSTGAYSNSARGTKFVDLVIAGHHIKVTPKPNTRISLPGIGYVILNQQSPANSYKTQGFKVEGIHVIVTARNKRAKIGTQVVVAAAGSALTAPVKGLLVGGAYGAKANVGKLLIVGATFPVGLGCTGTDGKTLTNSAVSSHVPLLLKTGTIKSTAEGTISPKVLAKTSSRIQGLNLLHGTITAQVIKAGVSASGNPPKLRDNSTFVNLKINGKPLLNVKANTKIKLAGLGTLWLHREVKTGRGIIVIMVQLIIGNPHNSAHLPKGAEVDIGYASAGVL